MKRVLIASLILAMVLGIGVATVFAHEEGCTPGYWKNHPEAWVISPDDDFDTTFSSTIFIVDAFDPDITLLEALNLKGGGVNALARHGVAGLLSALDPDVNYEVTEDEVIDLVASAVNTPEEPWLIEEHKDILEGFNEAGCPLDED